jgi:drug/metabolite transporter (DMT)-like permease
MKTRLAATALLIVAWGSTFTSIKVSLEGTSPMLLAGGRCFIGGALVALVAALLGRRPGLRGNLAPYAILTLLNVLGFFGLQTLAIDRLPSGFASLLLYLQPVLTVLLSAPLLGDRLTAPRLVGAVIAFVGVGVVSLHPDSAVSTVGVVLGVAAAVSWSLGTITAKRVSGRLEPLYAVSLPLVAGGAILSAYAGITGETSLALSARVGFALAWTILVGTTLAWLLWMWLVSGGDVGRVAVSIFLVPVVAVILGWWLLDEEVGWTLVAGTVLVCAGVLLVNAVRPQAPQTTSEPDLGSRARQT